MMKKTAMVLLLILLMAMAAASGAAAAEQNAPPAVEYVNGEVISKQALESSKNMAGVKAAERVKVRLTSGEETGKEVECIVYVMGKAGYDIQPDIGDNIIVAVTHDFNRKNYNVADYSRVPYAYGLIAAFVVTLLAVGGRVGLKALFVVCFAIFIIIQVMVPLILQYHLNIILITLLVSAAIATVTQVAVSGWNAKTWGAILGTVGGVAVAGILAAVAIKLMHLTGLDSEEAIMLKMTYLSTVDFREVLFAGVVLGALGAVMDVAISIASSQYEIKESCPHFGFGDIFKSGINVGRDIMGTMSNTLILAYIGSSLPLVLLLAAQNNMPVMWVMNLNLIMTEFVRALTGSIGLICSIPLTALVTAFFLSRQQVPQQEAKKPVK